MSPAWMTAVQAQAWVAGTTAADEAWESRPRRAIEDAPFWYTDAQKQVWVDEG